MRKFLLALLAAGPMLAASPTAAQTFTTDIHLLVLGDESKDGTTITVGLNKPVLTTGAVSPRAARLKQDVSAGSVGSEISLKEGTLLFGRFDRSVWTYCGTSQPDAESHVAGVAMAILTVGVSLLLEPTADAARFRCMQDGDKDGVFESAWGSDASKAEAAFVLFDMQKQPMSGPAAYERIDPRQGPATLVEIKWAKGGGSAINFTLGMGALKSKSASAAIPSPGGAPSSVTVGGVKLKLVAYDAAKNTITVQVEKGFRELYTRFTGQRTITTSYY